LASGLISQDFSAKLKLGGALSVVDKVFNIIHQSQGLGRAGFELVKEGVKVFLGVGSLELESKSGLAFSDNGEFDTIDDDVVVEHESDDDSAKDFVSQNKNNNGGGISQDFVSLGLELFSQVNRVGHNLLSELNTLFRSEDSEVVKGGSALGRSDDVGEHVRGTEVTEVLNNTFVVAANETDVGTEGL